MQMTDTGNVESAMSLCAGSACQAISIMTGGKASSQFAEVAEGQVSGAHSSPGRAAPSTGHMLGAQQAT